MDGTVSGDSMDGKIYKKDGSLMLLWFLNKAPTSVYNGYSIGYSNLYYLIAKKTGNEV